MNRLLVAVVVVGFGLLLMTSCLPDPEVISPEEWLTTQINKVDKTQLAKDAQLIDDSLAKWNLTSVALKEPVGVRYVITEMGNGVKPQLSDVVKAKYTGKLLASKTVFAPTDTLSLELYNLIVGWQTAMPLVPAGSKVTLYIPSGLGYGPVDVKNSDNTKIIIPKNSNLIFEIHLLGVN